MQPREIGAERRRGRAGHVAAKAKDCAGGTGEAAQDSSGVERTARIEGLVGNRRDPSRRARSGQSGDYKPSAKCRRAERESEGLIVPGKAARRGPLEGRSPAVVEPELGGKREGMAARPNYPIGKVRQLQRRLYRAAKRSLGRRFHALFDRICRGDVLAEAWKRVKSNRGASGVDGETLKRIEAAGEVEFLRELGDRLREGRYRPQPVRRVYIAKRDGRKRPLGIPTVRDRVVQAAAKLVLEPIFEAGFKDCSHGFRPRRGATGALEAIRLSGSRGHRVVVDGDIRQFFDRLDHEKLMDLVARRVSDRRVLKLLRQWLRAGVMEAGEVRANTLGSPQGGVISPLLANIYLDELDTAWERENRHLGRLVRYADDFVVLCRNRRRAEEALRGVGEILARLGLELHPEKTRIVELGLGQPGFDFLGCHLRVVRSHFKGKTYVFRWPSPESMNRIRVRIREQTDRRRRTGMRDVRDVVRDLNPILRGWGNYFRTGNASAKFQQVDRYVNQRLVRLLHAQRRRRRDTRRPFTDRRWSIPRFVEDFGLHRLVGTIHYPGAVHAA